MVYCGTDIIEVKRVKDAINSVNGFRDKMFSKKEIADIELIKSDYKYQRYAGRFAAKEAIYKAISKFLVNYNFEYLLEDVEILNVDDLKRRPEVNFLNDNLNKVIKQKNIKIDVSISHISEFATSVAVISIGEEI